MALLCNGMYVVCCVDDEEKIRRNRKKSDEIRADDSAEAGRVPWLGAIYINQWKRNQGL